MPRVNKTKMVKLRVTPDEYSQLATLARPAGGVSALIRKRVFGGRVIGYRAGFDAVLHLARMHTYLLQIAEGVCRHEDTLSLALVLSQLVAIERQVNTLLTQTAQ
jgi:hypothetical protein